MPAVPIPDPDTQQVLDDARSQAAAGLKGRFPDSMLSAPPPAAPGIQTSVTNSVGQNADNTLPPAEPGPDSTPIVDSTPAAPGPDAVPVKPIPFSDDLIRNTKDLGSEVGNGVMRAGAAVARTLGYAAAGANNLLPGNANIKQGVDDKIFNFLRDHVETAYDHWKGDPNASAPAQMVGNVAEGVAPVMLGPGAAVPVMMANSTVEKGKQSVDAGDNTLTAGTLAAIAGITTRLQLGVGYKDPNIIKRVAKWIGAGEILDQAGKTAEIIARHLLQDESVQTAVKKVDPLNPSEMGINAVMQAIFGALHTPKMAPLIKKADPTPPDLEVTPPTPGPAGKGTPPPPPPAPAPAAKPIVETPAAPVVPDKPSAEPSSDLRAQVADMKDPATDRKHVYLSSDNVTNLGGIEGVKKLADGAIVTKDFDKAGGALISATHSDRSKATALRKANGDDMQKTLGALTGAGEGKAPDQTAVVQGQTPEGAVVKEQMVAPADVPAAVDAMKDAGHEPVVTTPEAAQQRRAAMVEHENSIAPEPAEQAKPVTEVTPEKPKPVDAPIPEPTGPSPGQRHIVTVGGEDVPVVVAGETIDNKVPVHTIDDEGRLSKDTRNVPLELFKKKLPAESAIGGEDMDMSKPATDRAAERERVAALRDQEDGISKEFEPEPIPRRAAETEGAAALRDKSDNHPAQQVLDKFNADETVPPGKKFPAPIAERAASISETARAVKALAGKPEVDSRIASDAIGTAYQVARLDLKSPEAMAKNQGISHKAMDIHAAELRRVLKNLTGTQMEFNDKPVQVKAEKLKLREAAKRAAVAEPKPATKGEAIKEKVKSAIPDVADETKPKILNMGEKTKIAGAIERYNRAGDEGVQDAHDNLERILHDVYGDGRRQFADNILTLAREQREDARTTSGPKRMSDTVDEDELKGHDYDPNEHEPRADDNYGDTHESHEERNAINAGSPIGKLHTALDGTGFWKSLSDARDKGSFVSTHKILDHLLKVSKESGNEPIHTLLTKVREHVPDLPIRPVEKVINPVTGRELDNSAGVFHSKTASIQVKIPMESGLTDSAQFARTHALVHEIIHGATSFELRANPTGIFAKDVERLLAEARRRVLDMPGEVGKNHYGLTDVHEFLAESLTNPVFQDFLARSESAAKGYRSHLSVMRRGILEGFARAVAKLLGFKGDPQLLRDVMSTAEHGMQRQSGWMGQDISASKFLRNMPAAARDRLINQSRAQEPDHMAGLDDRLDQLHQLGEPPPDLQHEDEFRAAVGPHVTDLTKLFRRSIRSGAVETVRRTVRALTPYDGLVRAALRRGVFGHNDNTNPLRSYDDLVQDRNAVINRMAHSAEPIVNDRAKLSYTDNKALGQFQHDVQMTGVSPIRADSEMPLSVTQAKNFAATKAETQARWKNLTDAQRDIYTRERDWNEKAIRANRKASVDVALDSFSDKEVSKAQRQLLYSITNPHDFENIIGKGKEIDLGDRNDKLTDALKDLSSTSEIEGDYFHLGRHGDHVVQITPEGTKNFADQAKANAYADKIRALSPRSKAKVAQVGDSWQVDYKADYVSMHDSPAEADKEVERLRNQGHDVGSVTQKVLSEANAPLSTGMQNIVAEATRRLGDDQASKDLGESLRHAFVSLMAARSSYAGSKLARRNVGGVKPEEMGRNFATHAQSLSWNTGHIGSVFKIGEALGRLREAAKDASQPQGVASQRGRVYDEIQRRMRQETQQYGSHVPFNSAVAKLGFLNYMTSVSHSLIYLTQNFTTAIPAAGARFGYGKSIAVFAKAMNMISGPAFRETYRAVLLSKGHNVDSIQNAIVAAVAKHPEFGKWAAGGKDSPFRQLIDRGIIHTSLSNQLATAAKGGSAYVNRVMQWARILPSMADIFNRVSTGVAALELHKGDVYRAGDFVRETHVDYSQENKSRAFRAVGKVWGGNSVTMFKSYMTGMAHLLYSHVYDAVGGESEGGRGEALKTVAGLMVGTALFAGVQKGFGLEPIRSLMYAYNKLAGDNNEYNSFDNMSRRAVANLAGDGKLAEVIDGGLPRAFGFDMSSRMGLSDLILKDPPDFLSMDSGAFAKFGYAQLGPIFQELAQNVGSFNTAMTTGRMDEIPKIIPIKAVQNVLDAYKAGTTGKVTSIGAQITEPSAGAAVSHAIGFRTAEEARIAEKAQTDSEYKSFANNKKYSLISAYGALDPADRAGFWSDKIVPWNQDNPGHRITRSDVIKQARGISNTERAAQDLPGRDPVQNELNDY